MNNQTILLSGNTPAIIFAGQYLKNSGFDIQNNACLNTKYVLFDVPTFQQDGNLRNGQNLDTLLTALPEDVILCGGNLFHPKVENCKKLDFLQDELYLALNAAITAECAVRITVQHLTSTLKNMPVLVIGWGRIGKCLGQLLKSYGCNITIAARKEKDRAMLAALGYTAIPLSSINPEIYHLIYNTVPEHVLDLSYLKHCVKIDLAAQRGLTGNDIIWARGLPGMYAPESSGKLIAQTFLRLIQEELK